MNKLFIHAVNIHQGGGKILLDALIKLDTLKSDRVFLLDKRMVVPNQSSELDYIKRVSPSVLHRFLAEWWLSRQVRRGDTLLCFGNLPPLFKVPGHVVVFVQNRYLLENVSLSDCTRGERFRLRIERLWIRSKLSNTDEFIVQTPSMKIMLGSMIDRFSARNRKKRGGIKRRQIIRVLPLVDSVNAYQRKYINIVEDISKVYDFVYVASGTPYKNHKRLIEAWALLAEEGVFPSLCLTFDKTIFSELSHWVDEKITRYDLNVENVGNLPHEGIIQLYGKSKALIYPSTFESFGLPLIEARQMGLSVIASELDYVRDVLDPEESFNPESAISISRAVCRFLKLDEVALPLQNAGQILKSIRKKTD